MQFAVLFAGTPRPNRKFARIGCRASGIPMEAKMVDYIRPTLAVDSEKGRARLPQH
jgi:hypothetical protein